MQKRSVEYDFMRVILTLTVIIGHTGYTAIGTAFGKMVITFPEHLSPHFNGSWMGLLQYCSFYVYRFHMPAFFVLSGAVYRLAASKGSSYDQLCATKIRRLILPYIFTAFLYMLPLKLLSSFYNWDGFITSIQSLLSGSGVENGHLWFLLSLFWCFILFWPLEHYAFSKSIVGGVIAAVILILLCQQIPFDLFEMKRGINNLGWFVSGYVFQYVREVFWKDREKVWEDLLFASVLLLLLLLDQKWPIFTNITFIPCATLFIFFLSNILSRIRFLRENWVFKLLLRNSFMIYLLHDPLEYVILRLAFDPYLNWLTTGFGVALYAFSRTFGVIIISVLLGEGIRFIIGQAKMRMGSVIAS